MYIIDRRQKMTKNTSFYKTYQKINGDSDKVR